MSIRGVVSVLAFIAAVLGSAGADLPVTPNQAQGPYYPVNKPDDRDSDLVQVAGRDRTASGEFLILEGTVRDPTGRPLPGVTVEIWQTDDRGVYLHPRDPDYAGRDPFFQHYGEAVTGPDGGYRFRTILPGLYGSRPRHIHVRLRVGSTGLLTTQFYFPEDPRLRSTSQIAPLLVEIDSSGDVLAGRRDVVLSERAAEIVRRRTR